MTTILLVDTPEGDASVLASALRVEGYEVAIVSTAAEARRQVAGGMVGLAVIDLMLRSDASSCAGSCAARGREQRGHEPSGHEPSGHELEPVVEEPPASTPRPSSVRELAPVRNGLELARELRANHPLMRVLLTSSYLLSERQLERADCGVSGFIPKPYELGEVVEFIRSKVAAPPSSRRLWHAEPGSGVMRMQASAAVSRRR